MVMGITACEAYEALPNEEAETTIEVSQPDEPVVTDEPDKSVITEEPYEPDETVEPNEPDITNEQEPPLPITTTSSEFDFVVIQFNERTFQYSEEGTLSICWGEDIKHKLANGSIDAIAIPFQQKYNPYDIPIHYTERENLSFKNGLFWNNISHITADFYIAGADNQTNIGDIESIMPYVQLGSFVGNSAEKSDTLLSWGTGYNGGRMTYTWDITTKLNDFDTSRVGTFDEFGYLDNGYEGLLVFGLAIARKHVEDHAPINITLHWLDVNIYVYDLDLFYSYVDELSAVNSNIMSDEMRGRVHEVIL